MNKKEESRINLGGCEFTVVDAPLDDATKILTYFERVRGYIQHEDGLINSRLTWSLTIHGFLFTIFGVLATKITDIFLMAQKEVHLQPSVIQVMSALFFLQVLISSFGALVGARSRGALKAAHCALRHIWSIALESRALSIEPVQMVAEENLPATGYTLPPNPSFKLEKGSRLLIDAGSPDEEIVCVGDVDGRGGARVKFAKPHRAGTPIRPLGHALLPKVVSGGAEQKLTSPAHLYYLALPFWATVIWIVLLALSLIFCIESLWFPQCFFIGLAAR